jgi:hypothetical protein
MITRRKIVLVTYGHPKPALYWTGTGWDPDAAKAEQKDSWSYFEFVRVASQSPYDNGRDCSVKTEFAP